MSAPNPSEIVKQEEQHHATEVVEPPTHGSTIARILRGGSMVVLLGFVALSLARRHKDTNAEEAAADGGAAGAANAKETDAGGSSGSNGAGATREPAPRSGVGCQAIRVEATTEGDRVHWWDASCRERTVLMVSPDPAAKDGDAGARSGNGGGYVREFTFERNGAPVVARGTGAYGYRGFGIVVAHYSHPNGQPGYADVETSSRTISGTQAVPLAGAHHLLYRFHWRLSPDAPVDVTVDWLFATGRDHPLYAITYDTRPAGPGVVRADSRAPYGDVAFEGLGASGDIGGVAWGDRYRFVTTSSGPLTRAASWDYREPNVVPFDRIWSASADAEMGLVGTARWVDKPQGGDYGPGAIEALWGTTGTAGQGLPVDWAWPFQMNQYDLKFTTASHRLAWGLTFGSVGQPAYEAFGRELAGYPFQSYAVHVVLGAHLDSEVMRVVADTEAEVSTEVSATRGKVATEAPGGPARLDEVTLSPEGWDSAYGVWAFEGEGHNTTLNAHFKVPAGKALASPMIRVHGWTPTVVRHLRVGKETIPAAEILATIEAPSKMLWLTIPRILRGDVDITID